jgi:hypothetical protein
VGAGATSSDLGIHGENEHQKLLLLKKVQNNLSGGWEKQEEKKQGERAARCQSEII